MTRDVHFIQYLRPDGRPKDIWIERPEEIAAAAELIWGSGLRLEAEVLAGGTVSLTVSNDAGDYAWEMCTNGPGIKEAVDRLISRMAKRLEGFAKTK
jgi:hypothetical protein